MDLLVFHVDFFSGRKYRVIVKHPVFHDRSTQKLLKPSIPSASKKRVRIKMKAKLPKDIP